MSVEPQSQADGRESEPALHAACDDPAGGAAVSPALPAGATLAIGAQVALRGPLGRYSGVVVAVAPYSVRISYTANLEAAVGWFIWEPGTGFHGKQHGMHKSDALFIDVDG